MHRWSVVPMYWLSKLSICKFHCSQIPPKSMGPVMNVIRRMWSRVSTFRSKSGRRQDSTNIVCMHFLTEDPYFSYEIMYKGCIFNETNIKYLQLYPAELYDRKSIKCNNNDGCNPASKSHLNSLTVLSSIVLMLTFEYICKFK